MVTYLMDEDNGQVGYRYLRMANHIQKRIEMGELQGNMPLPAERRLAEEYGVSLGTARRATEELRMRGYVYTLRSKGTFVTRQLDRRAQAASLRVPEPETV